MKDLLVLILMFTSVCFAHAQDTEKKTEFGVFLRNTHLANSWDYSGFILLGASAHNKKLYLEVGAFRNLTKKSNGVYAFGGYTLGYIPAGKKRSGFLWEANAEAGIVPKQNKGMSENFRWGMLGMSGTFIVPLGERVAFSVPVVLGATHDNDGFGWTTRAALTFAVKI